MSSDNASRMRYMREAAGSGSRRSASDGEIGDQNEFPRVTINPGRTWPDVNAQPYRSGRPPGWSVERAEMAEALVQNVISLRPSFPMQTIQRITGMLMQMDMGSVEMLLQNDDVLNARIDDAAQALQSHRVEAHAQAHSEFPLPLNIHLDSLAVASTVKSSLSSPTLKEEEKVEEKLNDDDDPLFYEPGRPGFYALRPGKSSPARLTAFRNVGR